MNKGNSFFFLVLEFMCQNLNYKEFTERKFREECLQKASVQKELCTFLFLFTKTITTSLVWGGNGSNGVRRGALQIISCCYNSTGKI